MNKADEMNLEKAIRQLKDIKQDKESFIENDREHDEIFEEDIKAIDIVLNYIDNSISKEVIENKKNQMLEEYKEVIKTNSTKAFIMKCQIEFAEELLEGK